MKDNECRIIKIEKDTLYEFIYENFMGNILNVEDVKARLIQEA